MVAWPVRRAEREYGSRRGRRVGLSLRRGHGRAEGEVDCLERFVNSFDAFGDSVALNSSTAVVGAPNAGSAYLFDSRNGRQLVELRPSDSSAGDRFGHAVAVSRNTVAVAAPSAFGPGGQFGAVYLFERYIPSAELPTSTSPVPRIDVSPSVPQPDQEKNLIFITHGWNGTAGNNADHSWVQTMAEGIRSQVGSEWKVIGWNWQSEAGSGPGNALNNAAAWGWKLGAAFDKADYDKVHLIAHSAGSAMVETIARLVNDGDTFVQTTFLDPYTPSTAWAEAFSLGADRSDNYIAKDRISSVFTEQPLSKAHNVDVTWLDPNRKVEDGEARSSHSWPWDFYRQTAADPTGTFADHGYGFALSPLYNNWDDSKYPLGNTPAEPGKPAAGFALMSRMMTFDAQNASSANSDTRLDAPLSPSNSGWIETSTTGTVTVEDTAITLATGSPVWLGMLVEITEPVNFLNFQAEFLSLPGAEGLLSVYWEGELVGVVDERFPFGALYGGYSLPLTATFDPGEYTLAFRLDPYTDVASEVRVDDIRTGFTPVPEPAVASLLACLSPFALLRRRRTA
jgi:hypothetical protein